MPRYHYRCAACNKDFVVVHTMEERLEKCQECGEVSTLTKVYTPIPKTTKKANKKKVGDLVKQHIEATKKEVAKEKKKLKTEEYRP
jgi:putative FmdB family regulatory protein